MWEEPVPRVLQACADGTGPSESRHEGRCIRMGGQVPRQHQGTHAFPGKIREVLARALCDPRQHPREYRRPSHSTKGTLLPGAEESADRRSPAAFIRDWKTLENSSMMFGMTAVAEANTCARAHTHTHNHTQQRAQIPERSCVDLSSRPQLLYWP